MDRARWRKRRRSVDHWRPEPQRYVYLRRDQRSPFDRTAARRYAPGIVRQLRRIWLPERDPLVFLAAGIFCPGHVEDSTESDDRGRTALRLLPELSLQLVQL